MNPEYAQLLTRAAELWQIAPDYWDIWGHHHITTPETIRTILEDLGVRAGNAAELEQSIAGRLAREQSRLVPPSQVIDAEPPQRLTINAPLATGAARVEVRREDGAVESFELLLSGHAGPQEAVLPVALPLGYHDVTVRAADRADDMRLIVAPGRAWSHPLLENGGRAAGIAIA